MIETPPVAATLSGPDVDFAPLSSAPTAADFHPLGRITLLPVSTYEGMFLLDSTKVAASWDDSVRHVHDILNKHQSRDRGQPTVGRARLAFRSRAQKGTSTF